MKQDIYQVEQIAPETWRIDECGRDNCYLLCGRERALLIDCTIGTGDLMDVVRTLTDLPLTVAVTHAHGDHAGGGYQFGTIYVPRAETDRTWRGPNMRVFRKQLLETTSKPTGCRLTTARSLTSAAARSARLPCRRTPSAAWCFWTRQTGLPFSATRCARFCRCIPTGRCRCSRLTTKATG